MAGLHAEKCSPEGGGGGLTRWRIEQGWQRLADTPPCVTWSLQVGEQFNGNEYGSSCTRVSNISKTAKFYLFARGFLVTLPFSIPFFYLSSLILSVLQRVIHSESSAGRQLYYLPALLCLITRWMNISDSELRGKYSLFIFYFNCVITIRNNDMNKHFKIMDSQISLQYIYILTRYTMLQHWLFIDA